MTLLLALLVFSLVVNFVGQVILAAQLEDKRVALAQEVDQRRHEIARLVGEVEFAESDVNVERIAREQLSMARPEDIVILPQERIEAPPLPASPPVALTPRPATPNWEQWWLALFPPPDP